MIKLIINGKELNVSEHAKKWFLKEFLDGKEGPFAWETVDGITRNHSITTVSLTKQAELF